MVLTPRGVRLAHAVRSTVRGMFWTAASLTAAALVAVVVPTIALRLAHALTGS